LPRPASKLVMPDENGVTQMPMSALHKQGTRAQMPGGCYLPLTVGYSASRTGIRVSWRQPFASKGCAGYCRVSSSRGNGLIIGGSTTR